jgi:CubicO group peptidase (beta-lactamase class C family)
MACGRSRQLLRKALLLAACCAAPAGAAEPTLARDLHALLHAQRLAGAVVATVKGAQTDVLGLGVFHTGTRQPLQSDHRVQVGSIAKTVLSLAVLRLVSQGKVDLDAPLTALLPALQLDNPWARSPVRLRHLLDMTSGLPDLQL